MLGLLAAGDPRGDVATAWTAKEAVRELYAHIDPALALEWVDALSDDMDNEEQPIEVRSLSVARSSAGGFRSPPGTKHRSRTGPPRRSTT